VNDDGHSMLAPASDAASSIATLWWLMLGIAGAVFVLVIGLYGYAALRRRGDAAPDDDEPAAIRRAQRLILLGGGVVPAVILVGMTAITIVTLDRLLAEDHGSEADVEVIGHQYWWEIRYLGSGAVTANELHLPVGRPTRVRLRTADVIHSFWVPRLHGKMDMTPGRTTELVLHPREAGTYRGFCGEFCGLQHSLMGLLVIAQPPDRFAVWQQAQARPAEASTDARVAIGAAVFARADCGLCHAVRGGAHSTPPAEAGPDLTHVASRRTLGSATVPNTAQNLRQWIIDPHRLKPGVRMPATRLPDEELDALVAYLESLR
jgi:cytochrome c oxidase subunit II